MGRVFGYGRGSTDDQEITLVIQEEACKREFEHRYEPQGHTWGGMFLDRGVSGSKRMQNRGEGFKMCLAVERGDIIIITKLDRGFRNTRDFIEQLDRWTDKGVALRMLDMDLDTSTPVGRMLAIILAGVAEFERARLRERMLEFNRKRQDQGKPGGGLPLYGWRFVGQKPNKRYEPCLYTRKLGLRIVGWVEAGWTYDRIYFHLIEQRVKKPPDWSLEYSRRTIWTMYHFEKILSAIEAELGPDAQQVEILRRQVIMVRTWKQTWKQSWKREKKSEAPQR